MSIKSIWESIELDQRQLKCLLDSFVKEPDEVMKAVILRDVSQAILHLQKLHSLVEDCPCKEAPVASCDEPQEVAPVEAPVLEQQEVVQIPLALNDTFLFARILFGGDVHKLKQFWGGFETCATYQQAESYLRENAPTVSEEDMAECLSFLEQFYSNRQSNIIP